MPDWWNMLGLVAKSWPNTLHIVCVLGSVVCVMCVVWSWSSHTVTTPTCRALGPWMDWECLYQYLLSESQQQIFLQLQHVPQQCVAHVPPPGWPQPSPTWSQVTNVTWFTATVSLSICLHHSTTQVGLSCGQVRDRWQWLGPEHTHCPVHPETCTLFSLDTGWDGCQAGRAECQVPASTTHLKSSVIFTRLCLIPHTMPAVPL